MQARLGPFRDAAGIEPDAGAAARDAGGTAVLAIAPGRACNAGLADWFELRASLAAAEAVTPSPRSPAAKAAAPISAATTPTPIPAWAAQSARRDGSDGSIAVR